MGMKKKTGVREQSIPGKKQLSEANRNNAGNCFADAIESTEGIEWESRDIALSDIRINDDNAIFRSLDDEEDIHRLAEDIKRNGLLHNLVVFPEQQGKETVYVLLSGERRYRALNYLDKQGDANWNKVKDCHVITSELTDNQKKVLLYTANLQVRGGFANEMIRRTAIKEYVTCLQKEPYNLTEVQAKKAVKEVASQSTSTKQIERDLRIEDSLNPVLKQMLNDGFLMRVECESYVKLDDDKQQVIAEKMSALKAVDCNSGYADTNEALTDFRNEVHKDYMFEITAALSAKTEDELDRLFKEANDLFDDSLAQLQQTVIERKKAIAAGNTEEAEKIEDAVAEVQEEKSASRRERKAQSSGVTFAEKTLKPITIKIKRKMESDGYKRKVAKWTPEMKTSEVQYLDELIEMARSMKAMIENAE